MDPAPRCRGRWHADLIEWRLWAALERVLQPPEMIAAEVAPPEDTAGARRAARRRALEVIEVGLATWDREAQRGADASAAEVIGLLERQEDRREMGTRRPH